MPTADRRYLTCWFSRPQNRSGKIRQEETEKAENKKTLVFTSVCCFLLLCFPVYRSAILLKSYLFFIQPVQDDGGEIRAAGRGELPRRRTVAAVGVSALGNEGAEAIRVGRFL